MDTEIKYVTIDSLMSRLAELRANYGDLPILLSSDSSDKDFLRPLVSMFDINITMNNTNENQHAVVLANYLIENIEK